MLIIGITGGSGSGKTTVVKKIVAKFASDEVAVVHVDCYYKDTPHLSAEERRQINRNNPAIMQD